MKLEDARDMSIAILADSAAITRQGVTVVCDWHRRADAQASEQAVSGIRVLYTGRKSSADHGIERLLFDARLGGEVTVATSDALHFRD